MLHVSMHGAGNVSNASNRPKTSIAANVAVAQSCAPMCASYAKVLGNGVLTRAMLSENYAGIAHGYRIVWCLGRDVSLRRRSHPWLSSCGACPCRTRQDTRARPWK